MTYSNAHWQALSKAVPNRKWGCARRHPRNWHFGHLTWIPNWKSTPSDLSSKLKLKLKWPRHLNSIVAFFMRFLFLFNLLVSFLFDFLYSFFFSILGMGVSLTSISFSCMTNMLFFLCFDFRFSRVCVCDFESVVMLSMWMSCGCNNCQQHFA